MPLGLAREREPARASAVKRWNNDVVSALTPILSSPGWELLASLQARQETNPIPLRELGAALRASGVEAGLAAAVLTQLALREAARTKFGPVASHMVFTRDGLEQATRLVVAVRHAQRFRSAGATRVADLGCGIGSDALAIAGLGLDVLAVDIDPDAAGAAAVNLRDFEGSAGAPAATSSDLDIAELAAEGVDASLRQTRPAARAPRAGSARITNPEAWSPPLSARSSPRPRTIDRVGVKVAPGIAYERHSRGLARSVGERGRQTSSRLPCGPPLCRPRAAGRSCLLLDEAGAAHSASPLLAG